jgi:hypothetical protein
VSLEQGQVLSEPGDFVENVYFPHTAVISFLAVMRQGQTVETATVGYTGVVGGVSGLGHWRAFARVVVQVPGTASRIPSARFRAAFRQSDRLATLISPIQFFKGRHDPLRRHSDPQNEKRVWDAVVTRISLSLRPR